MDRYPNLQVVRKVDGNATVIQINGKKEERINLTLAPEIPGEFESGPHKLYLVVQSRTGQTTLDLTARPTESGKTVLTINQSVDGTDVDEILESARAGLDIFAAYSKYRQTPAYQASATQEFLGRIDDLLTPQVLPMTAQLEGKGNELRALQPYFFYREMQTILGQPVEIKTA